MTEKPTCQLLAVADVAALCRVHPRTIRRWLAQGRLPQPIRFNRKVIRFRGCDIERWVNSQPRR